jgi:hypothetical protein
VKLRIARKMDLGSWKQWARADRDKRVWWTVYTEEQLRRAELRLRKSWQTRCPVRPDGSRSVSPDFFAANRIESRLARQRAIRRVRDER